MARNLCVFCGSEHCGTVVHTDNGSCAFSRTDKCRLWQLLDLHEAVVKERDELKKRVQDLQDQLERKSR